MNKLQLNQFILITCLVVPSSLYAQEQERVESPSDSTQTHRLEEVVVSARQILGSKFQARNRTGSAYYISPLEIQKLGYTDINRMLRAVPGVNMYEEDGFGLRPNISLRGTKAERSERINIMEDGILATPAPYSSPAAYYFPNTARMYAVEVLKGSSQVQYGPFTTGGAINMVSTPIPNRFSLKANASYGSYHTAKGHLMVGNSHKHWGYLVEYLRYSSEGFKDNRWSSDKGFVRNDLIAKLRANTARSTGINQSIELKVGYADEDSDETYLGLTEADFALNPYQRYAAAQVDRMQSKHYQISLHHQLDFRTKTKILTQAYYNYYHRNWYKLNDVRAGIGKYEKKGLSEILLYPETNERYMRLIRGEEDYDGEALFVRANNRSYYSRGIQSRLEHSTRLGRVYVNLEGAIRYHQDAEDRYQWDDSYGIRDGRMYLYLAGVHGAQANQITSASAWSSYALGKFAWDKMTVTAGLRYEQVSLHKNNFGSNDTRRSGHQRLETRNEVQALIPSLGLNYKLSTTLSAFAGIHKGFAPPSAGTDQKAESSVNSELGLRYTSDNLKVEAVGYYNAYSNMLGSDLAAAGGQGTLEQFDVGAARVYGAEFILQYNPLPSTWRVRMPLQVSYTYTDTRMLRDFESSTWGQVFVGDEIPYIYKHALSLQWGLEHRLWDINLSMRYNGDMRTSPGQGLLIARELVPQHFVLDGSVRVQIARGLSLKANAVNLLNAKYLVSRHPSGLRAGHTRGFYVGINYSL